MSKRKTKNRARVESEVSRSINGTTYVIRTYHSVMKVVLKVNNQTQAEAAEELGISLGTFQRIYREKYLPNFKSKWGMDLAERLKDWSSLDVKKLFPEAFYTKEFLAAPKTLEVSVPFRLIAQGKSGHVPLEIMDAVEIPQPEPKQKPGRKKRRKAKK